VETTLPPPPPPPMGSYPPPSGKAGTGKSLPTTEKLPYLMTAGNHLRMETRNRGNGEGILGIPPHPSECGASHSTPATLTFHSDPLFGKYFEPPDQTQPSHTYPAHKHLPKLNFPKFNGENPKIWAGKCEVYFDVFSIPPSLRTRYATLNFTSRAVLWLETMEVSDRIEDWSTLCQLVFSHWGKD
jgi:hypothetical protein